MHRYEVELRNGWRPYRRDLVVRAPNMDCAFGLLCMKSTRPTSTDTGSAASRAWQTERKGRDMKHWNPVPWLREMQAGLDPAKDVRPGMAADEIERLRLEVEVLRSYGNKDCTAMADAALEQKRTTGKGPWED